MSFVRDPVRILVDSKVRLKNPGYEVTKLLHQGLRYPNPAYQSSFITKQQRDDIPEWLNCLSELPGGDNETPRGFLEECKVILRMNGIPFEVHDSRADGVAITPVTVPLRDYQAAGVRKIVENEQGVLKVACGGGKTRMGIATIGQLGRSALICVHTEDLLNQWLSVIKELLGIDAGYVTQDDIHWKPVTVAMNRTLRNILMDARNEFEGPLPGPWDKFGVFVIDECHHCPSNTYQDVAGRIPARYRLGLTATNRDDSSHKVMLWTMGKQLIEVTTKELVSMGFLAMASIEEVDTEFEFRYSGPDTKRLGALTNALVKNEARNEIIAERAVREWMEGQSVVVMTNNKLHCWNLMRRMVDLGGDAIVLIGTLTKDDKKNGLDATNPRLKFRKKERAQALDDMAAGKHRLVIATSLLEEGIDAPILSRVMFALPGSSDRATEQTIGRIMRPREGKIPKLIDIIDRKVDTLMRRRSNRRSVYRKMGLI